VPGGDRQHTRKYANAVRWRAHLKLRERVTPRDRGVYVLAMGKERQKRERRHISEARLKWLSPLVRYSYSREAFILRGVGEHIGPVYRVAAQATSKPSHGRSSPDPVSPSSDRTTERR